MILGHGAGIDLPGFAERKAKDRFAVHVPAGRVLGLELRCPQRIDRCLVGLRQVRHGRAGHAGARAGAEGLRGTQQLCRQPRLTGGGCVPAQQIQQDVLGDPVVDLAGDPKRLDKSRFRRRHVPRHHRHLAQILPRRRPCR
jgi:hypothetical protein